MKMLTIPTDGVDAFFPTHLHFLITGRCNLDCPCCYDEKGNVDVPSQIAKQILTDFRQSGGYAVAFGGGEPLLHPNLAEIVESARRLGLYVAVTSNGTIPLPSWTIPPNRIHFSYDSQHLPAATQAGKTRREQFLNRLEEAKNIADVGLNIGLFSPSDIFWARELCRFKKRMIPKKTQI